MALEAGKEQAVSQAPFFCPESMAPLTSPPRRIDLHCHSKASTEADEAVLLALSCPESFSEPGDVYRQAKQRGMDFVTITDHDSIEGVAELLDRPGVIVGEELTCYFPEDHCKMHVLLWGITPADHAAVQAVAHDIYQVAEYIERCQIAHAVAHPVYRQNDKLERWHLERLMLMFKGFECLNGAHSMLHREAFEPMLDALTPQALEEMSRRQRLLARWPEPWKKARTAGSDDHGLFNIGLTWTEFPAECQTVAEILQCLREARCHPGGEAGSSIKLAHNFIGVGARYFGQQILGRQGQPRNSATGIALSALVGEGRKLRKRDMVGMAVKQAAANVGRAARNIVRRDRRSKHGTQMLGDLLGRAAVRQVRQTPSVMQALREGRAPLAEHQAMFSMIMGVDREVSQGIFNSVSASLKQGELGALFDAISAVAAHQSLLLPYYFALFHQNREREHLGRITGFGRNLEPEALRIGLFTDCLDDDGATAQFTRSFAHRAHDRGRKFIVHTCCTEPRSQEPWRKNFKPLSSMAMPLFKDQILALPPAAEVLEWADRQQFDAIQIDSIGPMGLAGWMAAKMLRVPLVCGFHTDVPELVHAATGDFRLTMAASGYTRWMLARADVVLTRSRASEAKVASMGVAPQHVVMVPAEIDTTVFSAEKRQADLWCKAGVAEPRRLLYRGRVSLETNAPLLTEAFINLCRRRRDAALIVVGEGPYLETMRSKLKGLPAYFNLPAARSADPATVYASSDLLVYPSRTDPLGQCVIEAQACGLPVLVSADGGPREMMDDGVSGMVLDGKDAAAWSAAIEKVLADEPLRQRMSRTAPHRIVRFARPRAFDLVWTEHFNAVQRRQQQVDAQADAAPATSTAPQTVTSSAPRQVLWRECSESTVEEASA